MPGRRKAIPGQRVQGGAAHWGVWRAVCRVLGHAGWVLRRTGCWGGWDSGGRRCWWRQLFGRRRRQPRHEAVPGPLCDSLSCPSSQANDACKCNGWKNPNPPTAPRMDLQQPVTNLSEPCRSCGHALGNPRGAPRTPPREGKRC